MAIRINRTIKNMLKAVSDKVTLNTNKVAIVTGDKHVENSIKKMQDDLEKSLANMKADIIGSADTDLDDLGEIGAYIGVLEKGLLSIIESHRVYNEEMYIPKTGLTEDNAEGIKTFIRNMGLVSENNLIATLESIQTHVSSLDVVVDSDLTVIPDYISSRSILKVVLPYPDGRSEEIIHYTVAKESEVNRFSGYNHFQGDLLNRTIRFHYINLANINVALN